MMLRVYWKTSLDDTTATDRLVLIAETLQAFGWDVVYDLTDRERPRVVTRAGAKELTRGKSTMDLSATSQFYPFRFHWADVTLRMKQPNLTVFGSRMRARIPSASLELARAGLRRLVHLTDPVFAGVGPGDGPHPTEYSLAYLGTSAVAWLVNNAPQVRLAPEAALGGWVLAHDEALDSRTVTASDAVAALSRIIEEWRDAAEAQSLSSPGSGAANGGAESSSVAPRQGITQVVPAAAAASLFPAMDPDVTALPIRYLGPVLPFAGTTSAEQVTAMLQPGVPTPDAAGETLAIGESPFMIHGFSLVRYANLRAALSRHGEEHEPTLRKFGLDAGTKQTLQRAFFEAFQQTPSLLPTFTQLVEVAKLRQG